MEITQKPGKPIVAPVRCDRYDEGLVNTAVAKGIALLGGAEAFFKKGEKIILKPNVLVAVHPDHTTTTHPAVMCTVSTRRLPVLCSFPSEGLFFFRSCVLKGRWKFINLKYNI